MPETSCGASAAAPSTSCMVSSLALAILPSLFLSLAGGSDPLILNVVAHLKDPALVETINCESGFKQFKDDGTLLRGTAGEIGIAQFKPETWKWMNTLRGTELDITNALAQLNMIEWAFSKGYQSNWVCYTMKHP